MRSEVLLASSFTRLASACRASTTPEKQMDATKVLLVTIAISAARKKPRHGAIEYGSRLEAKAKRRASRARANAAGES